MCHSGLDRGPAVASAVTICLTERERERETREAVTEILVSFHFTADFHHRLYSGCLGDTVSCVFIFHGKPHLVQPHNCTNKISGFRLSQTPVGAHNGSGLWSAHCLWPPFVWSSSTSAVTPKGPDNSNVVYGSQDTSVHERRAAGWLWTCEVQDHSRRMSLRATKRQADHWDAFPASCYQAL